MRKYLNQKKWMLLAIAWSILIFIGCSLAGQDLPKVDWFDNIDKLVHFVFFAIFVVLWRFGLPDRYSLLQILVIAIAYGIGLEIYQRYCVEGRSFDVWDIVADAFGALGGWWLLTKVKFLG